MDQPSPQQAKRYAALAYALALARGALSDVVAGEFDPDQIGRIYEATASARLAECLGEDEEALAVDWDDFLSALEKRRIQGDSGSAEVATG